MQSLLLKLPYELRDSIYKFALSSEPCERHLMFTRKFGVPLATIPGISQTCKQIRQETFSIWLGQNRFLVMCEDLLGGQLFRWLHALEPHAVFIKEIVIHFEFHDRFLVPYEPSAPCFVGIKIQKASIRSMPGVGEAMFRLLRVYDESTRPRDRFKCSADSRAEVMDSIARIAWRLTTYQPTNGYITSVLRRIIDTAVDFDGSKAVCFEVRGRKI